MFDCFRAQDQLRGLSGDDEERLYREVNRNLQGNEMNEWKCGFVV